MRTNNIMQALEGSDLTGPTQLVGSGSTDGEYQPPVLMRQPAPVDQVTEAKQSVVLAAYNNRTINHRQATLLANSPASLLMCALIIWNSGSCKPDDKFKKHDNKRNPMGGALQVTDEVPGLVSCRA